MHEPKQQLRQLFQANQSLFVALGDSYRQAILLMMGEEVALSVGEIANRMQLSRPTVSHHIKILRQANLVAEKRIGVRRYYYPIFIHHLPALKQMVSALEELEQKGD